MAVETVAMTSGQIFEVVKSAKGKYVKIRHIRDGLVVTLVGFIEDIFVYPEFIYVSFCYLEPADDHRRYSDIFQVDPSKICLLSGTLIESVEVIG